MEPLLSAAEQVLRHANTPALRLSVLLREIQASLGGACLDPSRFRVLLEGRPDRFRVLDPWRGPWRFVGRAQGTGEEAEPWVVAVKDDGDGASREGINRVLRKTQESVRWLALNLDPHSVRSVVRWTGHLLEGMEAQRAFRQAA